MPQPSHSQPLSVSQWANQYLNWVRKRFGIAPKPRPAPVVRGLPGQRKVLGARGDTCPPTKKPLLALTPETNFGLTVAENPTFFFYVPQTSAMAEFELLDEKDNELYKKTLTVTGTPGIVSLRLPAKTTSPPLEVGKNYHWYFSVICDPQDRTQDLTLEGWIQRLETNPTLISELKKATPRQRPALYAAVGAWYDALTALAEQRCSYLNDSILMASWAELLKSVELNEIAQEPLVRCST